MMQKSKLLTILGVVMLCMSWTCCTAGQDGDSEKFVPGHSELPKFTDEIPTDSSQFISPKEQIA